MFVTAVCVLFLHNHCFRFLLGHLHVPREIKNNDYIPREIENKDYDKFKLTLLNEAFMTDVSN